jgi:hypothetical protein
VLHGHLHLFDAHDDGALGSLGAARKTADRRALPMPSCSIVFGATAEGRVAFLEPDVSFSLLEGSESLRDPRGKRRLRALFT